MPRLFIAIDIPEHLVGSLSALKDESLHARWTPPEQYHITLRFLGNVDDETTAELSDLIPSIRMPSFAIGGDGLGAFPNLKRPRVLVVRVQAEPALLQLQQEVNRIATGLEIEEDRKPFNPHITLARLKEGARPAQVRQYVAQRSDFRLDSFPANEFHLYMSKVSSKGAVHTLLRSYALER